MVVSAWWLVIPDGVPVTQLGHTYIHVSHTVPVDALTAWHITWFDMLQYPPSIWEPPAYFVTWTEFVILNIFMLTAIFFWQKCQTFPGHNFSSVRICCISLVYILKIKCLATIGQKEPLIMPTWLLGTCLSLQGCNFWLFSPLKNLQVIFLINPLDVLFMNCLKLKSIH